MKSILVTASASGKFCRDFVGSDPCCTLISILSTRALMWAESGLVFSPNHAKGKFSSAPSRCDGPIVIEDDVFGICN